MIYMDTNISSDVRVLCHYVKCFRNYIQSAKGTKTTYSIMKFLSHSQDFWVFGDVTHIKQPYKVYIK